MKSAIIVLVVAWVCSSVVAIVTDNSTTLMCPTILTICYGIYKGIKD